MLFMSMSHVLLPFRLCTPKREYRIWFMLSTHIYPFVPIDSCEEPPVKGWRIEVVMRHTVVWSATIISERKADLTSDYEPQIDGR
jgi:hypothetical protein